MVNIYVHYGSLHLVPYFLLTPLLIPTDGPLAVEVTGLDAPLMAGTPAEVECRTGGSRPPPKVIWTPEQLFESLGPPVR